ncbi:hypothetical protein NHX12_014756 [Muraenolepis orangiensis]|uniref:Uncharacterized protein n=1 Tax=Muraenolepis orangiensis TaxID=630683 RepID=A0A9Q0I3T7_9TELE|nr:hypothetical protein NHX12_014756 [Muraenolepis orangiensis]
MSDNNSSSRRNQGEQQPAKAAILCDICPADGQKAALKTCLKLMRQADKGHGMGPVRGRYALCLKGDQLSYQTGADNTVTEQSVTPGEGAGAERMSRPESVEVSWSPASSTVSFFSRSSARYGRRLIVSLDVSRDSPPLNPFVTLQSTAAHALKARQPYQQRPQYQQHYRQVGNYQISDQTQITKLLCELS